MIGHVKMIERTERRFAFSKEDGTGVDYYVPRHAVGSLAVRARVSFDGLRLDEDRTVANNITPLTEEADHGDEG